MITCRYSCHRQVKFHGLPAGLFAWAIWQGIGVTQYVRKRTILSLDLALR
ncbi:MULTISPECIES: hypothetical protein [Klebsiella]|nr:hypothetical protein [Klebsiella michiganensis]MDU8001000.1 hypothetical protein [Klebsiella sp.]ELI8805155.1 hypothetical protein [Klebsiella michiganensis]ELS4546656.1 hypothetical protein [Klebsiella michiganensis]MBC3631147.1 hypothetical protein [Klebsiella michiganensis]MBG8568363.1 hypothetical protein [Klebsiella michiganensis]